MILIIHTNNAVEFKDHVYDVAVYRMDEKSKLRFFLSKTEAEIHEEWDSVKVLTDEGIHLEEFIQHKEPEE